VGLVVETFDRSLWKLGDRKNPWARLCMPWIEVSGSLEGGRVRLPGGKDLGENVRRWRSRECEDSQRAEIPRVGGCWLDSESRDAELQK
jgi:hypothetical protein